MEDPVGRRSGGREDHQELDRFPEFERLRLGCDPPDAVPEIRQGIVNDRHLSIRLPRFEITVNNNGADDDKDSKRVEIN